MENIDPTSSSKSFSRGKDETTNEELTNMSDDQDIDYENDSYPPPPPMDPESSLDSPRQPRMGLPTTIYWDPTDVDGRKIGWKVKIAYNDEDWIDGRIVMYDPHTHKHKIVFESNGVNDEYVWIWIRNEQHTIQLATRVVWAHVKGYAWWPALVMESNSPTDDSRKDGYVLLEFFGTSEISTLRDTPESVRPFSPERIDQIVAKHKKKRNAKAYAGACEEFSTIRRIRNNAALTYAKKAAQMVMNNPRQKLKGIALVGKRVEIFRSNVNYPYGDAVVGKVRQYSIHQKKWLLAFEPSLKTKMKYDSAWVNLHAKEAAVKIIDKKAETITDENIIPFLFGWEPTNANDQIDSLLKTRCRGCLENLNETRNVAKCEVCDGSYHVNCLDPPITVEHVQKMANEGKSFVCSRCRPCRGCYRNDIIYGSHPHPNPPSMLTFPIGEVLDLCSMCKEAYDDKRFCPNCAHTWDDKKFSIFRKQMEYLGKHTRKRKNAGPVEQIEDSAEVVFGSFSGDEVLPLGAKVDPLFFHPETSQFGYTEADMLVCDGCKLWVHAGCAGVSEDDYVVISKGKHPIYSKEFLCRMCCRKRCIEIVESLIAEDKSSLFAVPVSEKVAPNYHDLIKQPMDLQTMGKKAMTEKYFNYAWIRELFELMVLNALSFNQQNTNVWLEAKRFYFAAVDRVFKKIGKAAPPGKCESEILNCFGKAEEALKLEEDRVQIDDSVEKKDLVAGNLATVTKSKLLMPTLRDAPPDPISCLPNRDLKLKSLDAFYCCWMECCFICGSSGASDTFLYCVDCGEAFHSFCVGAPVHSMTLASAMSWRCANCKCCEISGDVPSDETRMLFCEMCDRAFSIDLLDPPLTKAPPGLWICGQCVDCKCCENTSEKRGVSKRHWSRDPEKCFRCGGCEGLVKDYASKMKCQVCRGLLRSDDDDVVDCSECGGKVHTICDESAQDYALRSANLQQSKSNIYLCPRCCKPSTINKEVVEYDRQHFLELATRIVLEGQVHPDPDEGYSKQEMLSIFVQEIDWSVHNQWRDEYLAIIREGIRVYSLSKRLFNDARFVVQQFFGEGASKNRRCLAQRASRFVALAKQSQWDTKEFNVGSIAHIMTTAKLAAAFLDIACHSLGLEKRKEIPFVDRINSLLHTSGKAGIYSFPSDKIRRSQDVVAMGDKGEILEWRSGNSACRDEALPEYHGSVSVHKTEPLCGWSSLLESQLQFPEWKDPRQCCLCQLCGDDDVEQIDENKNGDLDNMMLGRLLPMQDGCWVHANCALWSSEVWESAQDSLIYSVEKARSRGAHLKCFGCGYSGATIGCNKSNCPYNFHLPCAKVCHAIFAANHQVFCSNHGMEDCATCNEGPEHMKALMVAPEKRLDRLDKDLESSDSDFCYRSGTLVVHSLGTIESQVDGFHSENYIFPPGYMATRIYWSMKRPMSRIVYILKVEKSAAMLPVFSVIPTDDPSCVIAGRSVSQVYSTLMERVKKINTNLFSQSNEYSSLPAVRRTRRKAFGLNGPQFFGFGLNFIRKLLETCNGVEAVNAPLTPTSPMYKFCFACSSDPYSFVDNILDLQRKRAANKAESELENESGCARTEGIGAVARSSGSGRITRALVRSAEVMICHEVNSSATSSKGDAVNNIERTKIDGNLIQSKYHRMKSIPIDQRLVVRRSHIHGWGLFTKSDILKDSPVVEYMGETIRQPIADKREKEYELSGEGSCYMFRLDLNRIVDATKIGSMARFMNHSCSPNAYAKIISVDTEFGPEKKIVIFAIRDIGAGEEITYDYKFPVEDGSLRCTCGAPTCIGRLN